MAYFVLTGSTDPVTPARTFDLVDDEKLAVEMVRVIETQRPATWSTILPVVARAGMQVRSHSALVEQAQQEFDDRDDEIRVQAEEVKAEALRRLGRAEVDDNQLDLRPDDDPPLFYPERQRESRPPKQGLLARRRSRQERDRRARERAAIEFDLVELADETPTSGPAWETVVIDPELPVADAPQSPPGPPGSLSEPGETRKQPPEDDVPPLVAREQPPKRPRVPSLLAGRRRQTAQITDEALPTASENLPPWPAPPGVEARSSEQAIDERGPQEPLDAPDGERKSPGAAKVDGEKRPRPRRRKEAPSPVGDVNSVDVPPKPDRLEAPVEVQDREPAPAAATSSDDAAETVAQPAPSRKRRGSSPAARPRRRAKPKEEPSVEQVDTASVAEAQATEGASLFSQRIAEYTLDHQRQSERERRSGRDRRSGIERREAQVDGFEGPSDRRAGGERRSGGNRRRVGA